MRTAAGLEAFDVLLDHSAAGGVLDAATRAVYGGEPVLRPRSLAVNFVESVDGVVALAEGTSSGPVISGGGLADRFVMGLLRAQADVVLIGSGTLRDSPGHHWTAGHIAPEFTPSWTAIRAALGIAPRPLLAIVTGSGRIETDHPAVAAGSLVLTTAAGARALDAPPGCTVAVCGDGPRVDLPAAVERLRRVGRGVVVSEAGPGLTGQMVSHDLAAEIFLTISPVIAGAADGSIAGFVGGVELLPARRLEARLLSVRHHDGFLFLRYALGGGHRPA